MIKHTKSAIEPYFFAILAIVVFGATLPVTKVALVELNPLFVFSARTLIASLLAIVWVCRHPELLRNAKPFWKEIAISAAGTVIGFPLLTSFALNLTGSSHSALVIALVPLMTSALVAWLFQVNRHWRFWAWAAAATVIVLVTIWFENKITWMFADTLLLLSALSVSTGYAFGSKVSRHLGGTSAISLALLISVPFVFPVFLVSFPTQSISFQSFLSLGYLGLFSMFLGFVFWYKALAEGPPEKVSLVQLLQVFVTYSFGALLLGEAISQQLILAAFGVVICLIGARLSP